MLAGIGPALADTTPAELKRLVDSYAANRGFNGVVLVAQHGRVMYRAAYGLANREWQVPNAADGAFRIGSLTKPFTAILVLQLVQEHKLRLDGTLVEADQRSSRVEDPRRGRNMARCVPNVTGFA